MERLHPRVRLAWAAGAFATAAVVGGGLALLGRFLGASWLTLLGGGLAAFLVVVGVPMAVLRYRAWRFDLQDDALYLQRGVVTEVVTAVPYVRVQHVDTRRGPVERALGLSTVVVYTAGSRGADVSVPGLASDRAQALRERLRDLAVDSEYEDAT